MSSASSSFEHDALFSALCDGQLDAEQTAAVTERIASDVEFRRAYIRYVDIHADLATRFGDLPIASENPDAPSASPMPDLSAAKVRIPSGHDHRLSPAIYATAAALLLTAAIVTVYLLVSPDNPVTHAPADGPRIATLIDATGTVIVNDLVANRGGDYAAGSFSIDGGSADFLLTNRVSVRMVGRSSLTMHSDMAATLHSGWAAFNCPPGATGYTVNLPGGMRIVDLGTDFAVRLEPDGSTLVEVYEGLVELRRDEDEAADPIRAGRVARIDPAGRVVVARPAAADVRPLRSFADDFDTPASYPGVASGGWATEWIVPRQLGVAAVADDDPLTTDGGPYLAFSIDDPTPGTGLARAFAAHSDVDPLRPYVVSADVRIDSPGIRGFQFGVRNDPTVNSGPDVLSWIKVDGDQWFVMDGDGRGMAQPVKTGFAARSGRVYHVSMWIDPVGKRYVVSIDERGDGAPAFVSEPLGLRGGASIERPCVFVGTQASGDAAAFSIDSLMIAAPADVASPPRPAAAPKPKNGNETRPTPAP